MNFTNIQKISVSFGLFSFGFLCFGSILAGTTVLTGIVRGVVGAVFFGLLIWLSAIVLLPEIDENLIEDEDQQKGLVDKETHFDKSV